MINLLLTLALLLAPLEFSMAHEMGQMPGDTEMQMQHGIMAMDHDAGCDDCNGKSSCQHCVYCSPAMSVSTTFELDKVTSDQPQALQLTFSSIDLPVDSRPPRQL